MPSEYCYTQRLMQYANWNAGLMIPRTRATEIPCWQNNGGSGPLGVGSNMVPLLTLYVSYAMKRLDGAQQRHWWQHCPIHLLMPCTPFPPVIIWENVRPSLTTRAIIQIYHRPSITCLSVAPRQVPAVGYQQRTGLHPRAMPLTGRRPVVPYMDTDPCGYREPKCYGVNRYLPAIITSHRNFHHRNHQMNRRTRMRNYQSLTTCRNSGHTLCSNHAYLTPTWL